jgi:hypothetical protein
MTRKIFAGAIIGLSLLALAAPRNASAQIWNTRVYGGWSNASFYGGSNVYGTGDRNGFVGGADVEYVAGGEDRIGYELGLAYVQKGAKGTIAPNEVDPVQPPFESTFEGEAKIDYFEINFLFNFYLPLGAKSDLKFGIGPAFGMLTSAKAEGTLDGDPVEADLKDYLTSTDFGVVLGAGFVYDLKRVSLSIEGRADFGALSIDDTAEDHDLKTMSAGVVLGLVIPFAQSSTQ